MWTTCYKYDTYSGPNCINNVSSTALEALASIGDHDWKIGFFIEDLLNATIVATRLLPLWGFRIRGCLFMGNIRLVIILIIIASR